MKMKPARLLLGFMQDDREISRRMKTNPKGFGLRNRKKGVAMNLDREVWERDRQGSALSQKSEVPVRLPGSEDSGWAAGRMAALFRRVVRREIHV